MSDRSKLIATGKPFKFDKKRDTEFEQLVKRYPSRESMVLPALWLVQEQESWVCQEAIGYIADRIGTFASKVYEVATFYSMFNLHPVGKYHICVCRTLSCWLRGKQDIVNYFRDELNLTPGKATEDKKFSLEEVECLGHCGSAPVLQINGEFYENMDVDKVKKLLATFK
ncbi:NADH-quinone oxidoreductase subunit NuoE [Desulforhopalus vacuolatus]|uniref:NADH-quinone oxidoreductase subunit NuoE n=1 Tax=Desulforhopalus vacuolatus TaxID=40414 RepID=UPI00196299D0|nr:NADH-quinone oxidoreductase subunit NuoE [Desulforhopalus vacuolatus]MBM9519479.1 NADH-quinone oxidoreductase subunit NuoE [Desulforhopalus vacuolatus]